MGQEVFNSEVREFLFHYGVMGIFGFLSFAGFFSTCYFTWIFAYRLWRVVPKSQYKITPGWRIMLTYIPFFRFGWNYCMWLPLTNKLRSLTNYSMKTGRVAAYFYSTSAIILSCSIYAILILPWSYSLLNGKWHDALWENILGWLFIGLLFIPILILGTVLYFKDPQLLKKRLDSKEEEKTQKAVLLFSAVMFVCGFVIAGLDHRFGWSKIGGWAVIAASAVLLLSYALYAEVMRENAYLSRKIEVQENQTVITTGPYRVVRHPMYSATLLLFLAVPLILGSVFSLSAFLAYPFIIAFRIQKEEELLAKELDGYQEYKQKVKYRLIPFVW